MAFPPVKVAQFPGWAVATRASALFAILAFALFAWVPAQVLATAWRTAPDYSHGVAIVGLAAHLAWQRRRASLADGPAWRWPGLALLGAGVSAMLLGHWYDVALQPGSLGHVFLRGLGVIASLAGLCVFAGSVRAWRRFAVPLAYLLLAVPLPETLTAGLTLPLQTVAARGAAAVLRILGYSIFRRGNVLELASGSLGVEEACSGLRSFWVLLAVAAWLICAARIRHPTWLLLSAPVLAVGWNMARVTISGVLLAGGHPQFATGRIHEALGLATLAGAGTLLLILAAALRRRMPQRTSDPVAAVPSFGPAPACLLTVAGMVFCVGFGLQEMLTRRYAGAYAVETRAIRSPRQPLAQLPARLGGFEQIHSGALTPHEVQMLEPTDHLLALYRDERGSTVRLLILYWDAEAFRPGRHVKRPHNPEHCYFATGWQQVRAMDQLIPNVAQPDGLPMYVRLYTRGGRRRLAMFWSDSGALDPRVFVTGRFSSRLRALIRSWSYPPEASARARYGITVAVEVDGEMARARETAVGFIDALAPRLPDHGIPSSTVRP